MDSKTIQKYKKRSIPWLRKKAGFYFRKYIRERDKEKGCVSCDSRNVDHAGHFYSAGHYPSLEFNTDNTNGQCIKCNTFLHGNLNEYRIRLFRKIGKQRLEELDQLASYYKRHGYKHDRFYLIETIETYKNK